MPLDSFCSLICCFQVNVRKVVCSPIYFKFTLFLFLPSTFKALARKLYWPFFYIYFCADEELGLIRFNLFWGSLFSIVIRADQFVILARPLSETIFNPPRLATKDGNTEQIDCL